MAKARPVAHIHRASRSASLGPSGANARASRADQSLAASLHSATIRVHRGATSLRGRIEETRASGQSSEARARRDRIRLGPAETDRRARTAPAFHPGEQVRSRGTLVLRRASPSARSRPAGSKRDQAFRRTSPPTSPAKMETDPPAPAVNACIASSTRPANAEILPSAESRPLAKICPHGHSRRTVRHAPPAPGDSPVGRAVDSRRSTKAISPRADLLESQAASQVRSPLRRLAADSRASLQARSQSLPAIRSPSARGRRRANSNPGKTSKVDAR